MGDKTKIEWTDASWTPIRAQTVDGKTGWHCEHASEGCRFCYAESMNRRLGTRLPFKPGHRKDLQIFLDEKALTQPLRWKAPRKIFVCSMTDLFASFVPDDLVDRMFAVMALAPHHTFQILTKRPDRMRTYIENAFDRVVMAMFDLTGQGWPTVKETCLAHGIAWRQPRSGDDWWPLRNAWLGTSVEDQANANARIPHLLATPARIRFLSCEPMLGPISLDEIPCQAGFGEGVLAPECWGDCNCDAAWGRDPGCRRNGGDGTLERRIDWVICGGESGRGARPMHPAWPRQLRDQCAAAGVAFHFKQWGEWASHTPIAGGDLGGDVRAGRVRIVHPTGQSDVEVSDVTGGRSTIPGSRYMKRVGKSLAGRELDGATHNGFPA
jgi:protein gp37